MTLGWGVMGTGIALTLGGSPVVCLLAFFAAVAIDGTQVLLPLRRIPAFYQQAAGGFVATLIAVIAAVPRLEVDPSRVVTAGIVMLLAGVGITGATQDALTGFPVTATARLLDALLNTAGIIAGVGAGLTLGGLLSVELGTFTPGAAGLAAAGITVFGAALAAAGFAFASCAPLRSLVAVALVAGLGQAVLLAVDAADLGRTWGSASGAVTIGAICYVVSGRFRVPPLVVVVPAIVPLLPGLDIYRVSPCWPLARTVCSSWRPRSRPPWHSRPGSPSGSTSRSRSSARRDAWALGCQAPHGRSLPALHPQR